MLLSEIRARGQRGSSERSEVIVGGRGLRAKRGRNSRRRRGFKEKKGFEDVENKESKLDLL